MTFTKPTFIVKSLSSIQGPGKKEIHIFLACGAVTCVTSAGTYLDMHRRMGLVDEPTAGAILWIYLFP